MKTIGLIGGMSWESTAVYYRRLNEQVRRLCGGLHSAEIVMRSVDFESIVAMQTAGDWDGAAGVLQKIARELEAAGAILRSSSTPAVASVVVKAIRSMPPPRSAMNARLGALCSVGVRMPSSSM